jgi:hypothetical protein
LALTGSGQASSDYQHKNKSCGDAGKRDPIKKMVFHIRTLLSNIPH